MTFQTGCQLDFARPVRGPVRWPTAKALSRVNDLARASCTVSPPRVAFALSAWAVRHRERRDHKGGPSGIKGLSLHAPNDTYKVELRGLRDSAQVSKALKMLADSGILPR